MRSLTEEETRTLFTKLAAYTGRSLNTLIAPAEDGSQSVFRLQGSRVYYVDKSIANLSVSFPRDALLSMGTMVGKFTKTGKFRINLTALDLLAQHARYKVWIKDNGVMPLLYGGSVLKAHISRWSDETPDNTGVVIMSSNDVPLGFGVTARSSTQSQKLEPTSIVVHRQADTGEYLREEDTLFTT
ncbi:Pseudouridine synthase/archaeosine transglycosylase [Penicillium paradoxum]|uniref:Pseudouridine synthase/archaeosine transglycosylase n=1 Tax=Penicillium paradoxum TaxID=176176 RepID=UPI0025473A2E|nr:Pseudouridine synthase/archaeosine transglycosylase [Penicillium paradoxum]KAJ5783052.1 Pseudouridine synthase/archaeosine transglycosylase [Penicillium paradoxum]